MASEDDQVNGFIDMMQQAAISKRKPESGLKPEGDCHNCGKKLRKKEQLFCDRECSDDWELYNRRSIGV